MNYTGSILEGLLTTLMTVLLSAVLPLAFGIGLTVLMHYTRQNIFHKIVRYFSMVTECFVPSVLITVVYFFFFRYLRTSSMVAVIITLSVSFLLYMPHQYDNRDSLAKNIVVNGIDLIAQILKWSIAIASLVGVADIVLKTRNVIAATFDTGYYFLPLIVSFVILLMLYVAKNLCKDLMK